MPRATSRAGHTYAEQDSYTDSTGRQIGGPQAMWGQTVADKASYGGSRQAAEDEAKRLDNSRNYWDSNQWGTKLDQSGAQAARGLEQQSRGEQLYGVRATNDLANGSGPSAARAQFGAGLEASIAASAGGAGQAQFRGGAGQVLGGYAQGRGGELAAARQAHLSGAGEMRSGDLSMARADTAQQQAAGDIFYRQRGIKDQMAEYYGNQAMGARLSQMQAENFTDAAKRRGHMQNERFHADAKRARDEEAANAMQTAGQVAATAAMFMSDVGAKRYFGRLL